jgi:hypothetical protein
MEWLIPDCWTAARAAPIAPMTWWSWHCPLPSEPANDEGVDTVALGHELTRLAKESSRSWRASTAARRSTDQGS